MKRYFYGKFNRISTLVLMVLMAFMFCACAGQSQTPSKESYLETFSPAEDSGNGENVSSLNSENDETGVYTSKEDVSLYIFTYGKLPNNFITKKEAKNLGWQGGGLDDFIENGCIGGDYFGNYEGILPEKEGREYHECDIDTLHANNRGVKRLVYSNDGLIYYTEDHYETFELLYGEEP